MGPLGLNRGKQEAMEGYVEENMGHQRRSRGKIGYGRLSRGKRSFGGFGEKKKKKVTPSALASRAKLALRAKK